MIPIVYNGNIALVKLIKDQWCIRVFNSEHVVVEVMLVNKTISAYSKAAPVF